MKTGIVIFSRLYTRSFVIHFVSMGLSDSSSSRKGFVTKNGNGDTANELSYFCTCLYNDYESSVSCLAEHRPTSLFPSHFFFQDFIGGSLCLSLLFSLSVEGSNSFYPYLLSCVGIMRRWKNPLANRVCGWFGSLRFQWAKFIENSIEWMVAPNSVLDLACARYIWKQHFPKLSKIQTKNDIQWRNYFISIFLLSCGSF